jgi:DNA polymerase III alpha subunit
MDWNIPIQYQQLDIVTYIIEQHSALTGGMIDEECVARDVRLAAELIRFCELGLLDMLRTMVYIVDRLVQENIVWGVGRGSSVSSYVLYIIGVHDVDSFKYNLDMDDFLHQ